MNSTKSPLRSCGCGSLLSTRARISTKSTSTFCKWDGSLWGDIQVNCSIKYSAHCNGSKINNRENLSLLEFASRWWRDTPANKKRLARDYFERQQSRAGRVLGSSDWLN